MASSRMQRWSLTLLAYEYELLYRPGSQNGNADGLSRLPLADVPEITPVPGDVIHLLETISTSPVDATKVKLWTARDPVLSLVLQFVLQGWPLKVEDEALKPYFTRREELSVYAGCLLWGTRVVIPPQGREEVLNTLHESHPGIVRMKNLARSLVAENGHTSGRKSQKLCYLPEPPEDPSLFAFAPLGMARPPLGSSTHRLRGAVYGKDVSFNN